jgi:YVTN family beta-propeller protein
VTAVLLALSVAATISTPSQIAMLTSARAQPGTVTVSAHAIPRERDEATQVESTTTVSPTASPAATPIAPYSTTVTVTPPVVSAGGTTLVTASGFSPGERLLITFSGGSYGYGLADAAGKLAGFTYSVPATAAPGTYRVTLTGMSSGRTAGGAITVVSRPAQAVTLDASPLICVAGSTITVSGSGFTPKETIVISLDGVAVTSTTADSTGSFAVSDFHVPPAQSAGLHEVSAVGHASGGSAAVVLTITAVPARLTLSPRSVVADGLTTLTGAGFAPREHVIIKVDGKQSADTVSDASGTFSVSIHVTAGTGSHRVTATGSHSRKSVATTIVVEAPVKPVLSLRPASAHPSEWVVVGGMHFAADEIVLVRFDGTLLQAVNADRQGRFENLKLQVPKSARNGRHTITASGVRSGRSASAGIDVVGQHTVPAATRTPTATVAIATDTPKATTAPTFTPKTRVKPTAKATATRAPTATPARHAAITACETPCTVPLAGAPLTGTHAPYGNAGLLAVDSAAGRAFVAISEMNRLVSLDLTTRHMLGDQATGSSPWMLAVDPAIHRLFVANGASASIGVYDTRSGHAAGKAISLSNIANGGAPYALAVDVPTKRLFVITGRRTCALDASSAAVLGCVISGDPYALSVSSDGSRVYVLDQLSPSSMLVLDGRSGKLVTTVALGDALPWAVVAVPAENKELVSLGSDVGLIVADRLQTRIHIGTTPRAIVVDRSTGHAFVLDPADGKVAILDTSRGKLLRMVKVGVQPSAATLDSTHGRVYVANQASGTVSVLSATTGQVVRTVRVGTQPIALAVDESRGLVIVLNGGASETDHAGSVTVFKTS